MMVRLGLPKSTGELAVKAFTMGAPALVSANSLWDNERKHFRKPGSAICDLDVALDSAGYVAMSRYGGYRWTVEQYVELAAMHGWTWWAQMDFCCEPKARLAAGRTVRDLQRHTAVALASCRKLAGAWREKGIDWLQDPMPVVQGWEPGDYGYSLDWTDDMLDGEWPDLIGVGSVCGRHVKGPTGVLAVVGELDRLLPKHVNLHLFGVKGSALEVLHHHPRVVSTDSQAWGLAVRYDTDSRKGESATNAKKVAAMSEWYDRQAAEPAQLVML